MDPDRLVAFGAELARTHERLRVALARLRAGDRPPADLRDHCLAFCAALTAHHSEEDGGVFPALAARRPGLRPLIAKMAEDHALIATILARVEAGDATELDGLAAILDSHFAFEERRLLPALRDP